ncbi:eukaryotic translation initiation factor 3subunit A [Striga asiatica]|uniref:Eukaryotic translation initiation factor 3subunit A n=1 Tax=Striga asiatica TaxID=4170 RepID=A0A5A7PZX0_STRAF|nr:eukaryotic translation initiation factor 3subunit A [Striga asiatica]
MNCAAQAMARCNLCDRYACRASVLPPPSIRSYLYTLRIEKNLKPAFPAWWRPVPIRVVLCQLLDQLLQTGADEIIPKIHRQPEIDPSAAHSGGAASGALEYDLDISSPRLEAVDVVVEEGERVELVGGSSTEERRQILESSTAAGREGERVGAGRGGGEDDREAAERGGGREGVGEEGVRDWVVGDRGSGFRVGFFQKSASAVGADDIGGGGGRGHDGDVAFALVAVVLTRGGSGSAVPAARNTRRRHGFCAERERERFIGSGV